MKCTVVTVCYNAETVIEKTLLSVLNQDFTEYEYVIVDGKSDDGTLLIVKNYQAKFEARGISVHVLSERDKGVYDAMNKALKIAQGQWVIYMNAGDLFYSNQTMKLFMADKFLTNDSEILYGDTMITRDGYYKRYDSLDMNEIVNQLPFCHQSVFVKRSLLVEYKFDTNYLYAADYDLFVRLYNDRKKFKQVNYIVSVYALGGLSAKNAKKTMKEYKLIKYKHDWAVNEKPIYDVVDAAKRWGIKVITLIFPKLYYTKQRGWSPKLHS